MHRSQQVFRLGFVAQQQNVIHRCESTADTDQCAHMKRRWLTHSHMVKNLLRKQHHIPVLTILLATYFAWSGLQQTQEECSGHVCICPAYFAPNVWR